MMNIDEYNLFATTAKGFEELLKQELEMLSITTCKITQGGISFTATQEQIYQVLLQSRIASRIFLPIVEENIFSADDLYNLSVQQNWLDFFAPNCKFKINFNGTNKEIRHNQYGAMRIKDAIVDYFTGKGYSRPSVDTENPDVVINARLDKDKIIISLDLSGEPLHKRGYRQESGQAPLRESLAAAVIMRSNWDKKTPILDPMCGSGTILIEAMQMALNIAPNLAREHWGFFAWKGYNEELFKQVKKQISELAVSINRDEIKAYGFDIDKHILNIAKENAKKAGLENIIDFQQQDITNLENPSIDKVGTIICNPPYGARLETPPALIALYSVFGQILKTQFEGWNVSIISSSPALLDCIKLRADRKFNAKNGNLDCIQKNYYIANKENRAISDTQEQSNIAKDLANRLEKNLKKYAKWIQKDSIEAYRLYDADIPEYNFAIDCYHDYVVMQEYVAPKNIDPKKVQQRLLDGIYTVISVLKISTNKLILKQRTQQKGVNQYEKLSNKGEYFPITEYGAKLWVNVTDYLDTGVFLDHRLTRKMLGEMATNKNFLNLFAYTGTATIHAVINRASTTTTIDMSNTYLNWAEQNFILNDIKIDDKKHRFIQADCLTWLKNCSEKYDIIFADPPTFSNSKKMQETWDVQRDHVTLIHMLLNILDKDGLIIFSNNKRGFRMSTQLLNDGNLEITDITAKTIPLDFQGNKKIHNTWLIKRR